MSTIKVNNIDTQSGTTVTVPTGKSFVITDNSGLSLGGTTVTATGVELNYVDGVSSAIQTQLDAKGVGSVTSVAVSGSDGIQVDSGSPLTGSGTIALGLTAVDATKIANGTVTDAEFQYINTLSSNAQTQITDTVTVANAALPKAGGTMTGTLAMADATITRPEITDYSETKTALVAGASVTCDIANGNVFTLTPDQNTTFVFSNPSPTGKSCAFTLVWTQGGSDRTITWPASVDWAGGSVPDVTSGSGKIDVYTFFTMDEGTIWYGFQAGADMG
jgi:hypothetical protein